MFPPREPTATSITIQPEWTHHLSKMFPWDSLLPVLPVSRNDTTTLGQIRNLDFSLAPPLSFHTHLCFPVAKFSSKQSLLSFSTDTSPVLESTNRSFFLVMSHIFENANLVDQAYYFRFIFLNCPMLFSPYNEFLSVTWTQHGFSCFYVFVYWNS